MHVQGLPRMTQPSCKRKCTDSISVHTTGCSVMHPKSQYHDSHRASIILLHQEQSGEKLSQTVLLPFCFVSVAVPRPYPQSSSQPDPTPSTISLLGHLLSSHTKGFSSSPASAPYFHGALQTSLMQTEKHLNSVGLIFKSL